MFFLFFFSIIVIILHVNVHTFVCMQVFYSLYVGILQTILQNCISAEAMYDSLNVKCQITWADSLEAGMSESLLILY